MTPLPARKAGYPTPNGPNVALLDRWVQFPEFGAFYKVYPRDEGGYEVLKAATTEDPPAGESGSRHQALEADYVGRVDAVDREFSDAIADVFGVRFPPNVDW